MPYEQIKQIGKRHIESVCLRTCQSGSKGNWRFPRKLSQAASHRGILSSWHLVQKTNDQTKKHQKLGGNCIANSGLLESSSEQSSVSEPSTSYRCIYHQLSKLPPRRTRQSNESALDFSYEPPQLQILYKVICSQQSTCFSP